MDLIQQFTRHHSHFVNYNNLNFWILFFSSVRFLSLYGINLPRQGIFKPECMVVLFILIAATPVGASTRTFGLTGLPLWHKKNLLSEWYTVLIKCDFLQPPSTETNKWNGTGTCFRYADLKMIYDFAQLYTKSNTCLCFINISEINISAA